MIAQHGAEGGVLGTVGKRLESPGDGRVLTQILQRWETKKGYAGPGRDAI